MHSTSIPRSVSSVFSMAMRIAPSAVGTACRIESASSVPYGMIFTAAALAHSSMRGVE
jgi:hypothetical protein